MTKLLFCRGRSKNAVETLAEQGFTVSVNRLRNVTAGLAVMLAKNFPPILDGTIGSCDQWFTMMRSCRQGLVVSKDNRVLFVADGAT